MRNIPILMFTAVLALSGCIGQGSEPMSFESDPARRMQSTIAAHLRQTLAALPPGAVIDAARFTGAGHYSPCDDVPWGPATPVRFHTIGELKLPGTITVAEAVTAVGEQWRRWGWQVVEREGFATPNRFGYSPDGYRLQIVTGAAGHPATVQGSSPCFPRPVAGEEVAFPQIITAG